MQKVRPGRYIIAVSGGVDSMVLLDQLRQQPGLELVVAHVNHGIRTDAALDESLVRAYAARHNLPCVIKRLALGKNVSEDTARKARYDFMRRCCKKYYAKAIITAHHQDDMVETALLALLRGTGWRGLAPFAEQTDVLRPLLSTPKWHLIAYARTHNIVWREDTTNADESYTRNYIRHTLIPTLDQKSDVWRTDFLQYIRKQQRLRRTITPLLDDLCKTGSLQRYQLIMWPKKLAYEVLQQYLRRAIGHSLERPIAEAALLFAKTAKPHKLFTLDMTWRLRVSLRDLIVELRTP